MTRLLVLRPEPGAAATVARAHALGIDAIAAPLFAIVPVRWDAPDPAEHDALLLTSANAVRAAGPGLTALAALPVYAVGAATAAAARAAGLAVARTGTDDAAALLTQMAAAGVRRPLHLAGQAHRDAVHPALTLTRRIVYAADAVAELPAAAERALAQGAVALVHSPRAGALLAALVDAAGRARGTIALAAISPAAAAAAGAGWARLAVAARPTDAALLEAARGA